MYIPTVLLISFVARRLPLGIRVTASTILSPPPIWNIVTIPAARQLLVILFFSLSNLTFIFYPLFLLAISERFLIFFSLSSSLFFPFRLFIFIRGRYNYWNCTVTWKIYCIAFHRYIYIFLDRFNIRKEQ